MKNKLLLFIIILILFGLDFSYPKNNLENIFRSMIKIEVNTTQALVIDPDGLVKEETQYGTGFYISDHGLIVTAAHLIKNQSRLLQNAISCSEIASKKFFACRLVAIDIENDIALLSVNSLKKGEKNNYIDIFFIPKFDKKNPICYCFGLPAQIKNLRNTAFVSIGKILKFSTNLKGHRKIPYRRSAIKVECKVTFGFSGGFIFDSNLSPIGLILGFERNFPDICYGARLFKIRKMVNRYENKKN